MRGFLAVFERELVERRLLAAAALLLGLVPLVTPLLPGLGHLGGPEVRSARRSLWPSASPSVWL